MTVDVVTLGCRLNIQESKVIRHHAGAVGLAGVAVVNTCAVTAEAVAKARQTIRRLKREGARRIVVTGCAAQIEPQSFATMPEVDRVIGNDDKLQAAAWVAAREAFDAGSAEKIAVGDIMSVREAAPVAVGSAASHSRAFVQVQNGCDHRCTFCVIPFGRGNARSRPAADVITQVCKLVESGHREIVLTGVDLTSYGGDLPGAPTLGALVKRILAEVPDLPRLRLSSIDSIEADRDLIDAFATNERLMPHLHLSLQAGDDLILKRMKRRHQRADAIEFCARMRRLRPEIVFGADIIAGFPTETEDMFARSVALVAECGLVHLHVFPFSPRPGTPAARMPQVAGASIKDRARRLRAVGDAALRTHLACEVGRRRSVLSERGGIGYTEHFTPVRLTAATPPGYILDITIAGHDGRHLIAA